MGIDKTLKRFREDEATGMIMDNMTGEFHPTHSTEYIINLLNKESERADKYVSSYSKLVDEFHGKNIELYEFRRIMRKYEIESIEKLDQILFEQKVW